MLKVSLKLTLDASHKGAKVTKAFLKKVLDFFLLYRDIWSFLKYMPFFIIGSISDYIILEKKAANKI